MTRTAAGLAVLAAVFAAVLAASTARPTTGESVLNPKLVAKGKRLYSSYSCSACHTLDGSGGAGPTFKHLAGARVKLSTGKTIVATDAYLLESIRDPDRKIVAGRPPHVMTTVIRRGQVSRSDALALVAFIKSLK